MRRHRILPLTTGALLTLAGSVSGQVTGSLDVGAGTYRPDRAIPGGIASIAPTLVYERGVLRVGGAGVYSDAPAGRWNFQATAFSQLRSGRVGIFEAELTGQFDVTRHFRALGSEAFTGDLRLSAYPSRGTSIWAGQAFGRASALGRHRPVRRSRVGGSARFGGIEFGLSLANTTFELMGGPLVTHGDSIDVAYPGATPRTPTEPQPTTTTRPPGRRTSLTDALLSTKWRLADFDLDIAVGRRFSQNAPELTIWGVSAARGITPQLDLVAGAGRSGSDPVTSVPGARYFVLGLRLRTGPLPGTSFNALPAAAADHTPLRIGPALPAGREVIIRVPGATRVELAGDFTDWRPVELQPVENAGWRAVLRIRPGLHRLAIRIDDGQWRPPPGARPVRNEFGGDVAEIVVE